MVTHHIVIISLLARMAGLIPDIATPRYTTTSFQPRHTPLRLTLPLVSCHIGLRINMPVTGHYRPLLLPLALRHTRTTPSRITSLRPPATTRY